MGLAVDPRERRGRPGRRGRRSWWVGRRWWCGGSPHCCWCRRRPRRGNGRRGNGCHWRGRRSWRAGGTATAGPAPAELERRKRWGGRRGGCAGQRWGRARKVTPSTPRTAGAGGNGRLTRGTAGGGGLGWGGRAAAGARSTVRGRRGARPGGAVNLTAVTAATAGRGPQGHPAERYGRVRGGVGAPRWDLMGCGNGGGRRAMALRREQWGAPGRRRERRCGG